MPKRKKYRELIAMQPRHRRMKPGAAERLQPLRANSRIKMTDKQRLQAAAALEHGLWDRYGGSNSAFCKEMGVQHTATLRWLASGVVPAERVMDVCDAMCHELVTPERLRPDVFREPQRVEEGLRAVS